MVSLEKPKRIVKSVLYFAVFLIILAGIIALAIIGSVVWVALLGVAIVLGIIFSIGRFFRQKLGRKENVQRQQPPSGPVKNVQVLDAEVVSIEEEK